MLLERGAEGLVFGQGSGSGGFFGEWKVLGEVLGKDEGFLCRFICAGDS